MKLDEINKWLTLVASFGVIASISFLAIEIQQNTLTLRAEAIQNSTSVAFEQVLVLVQLTDDENTRTYWLNRSFLIGMQGLYRQWEMSVLPDEEWAMWTRIICKSAEGGRFQELWPGNVETLIPAFIKYVEYSCGILEKTDNE